MAPGELSENGRAHNPPRVLQFGSFELRADTGELRKHGIRVRLQTKPLHVLLALLQHPGEVVTREQLQARLWPADTFVDFESGLNTAANRLRIALGDSADVPRYIETLPRIGYRFIAPVREVPVGAAAVENGTPAPAEVPVAEPVAAAVPAPPPPPPTSTHRRGNALVWITSAAALVLAALLLSGRFVTTVHGRQNPQFREITFSHGNVTTARFAPDGQSVVYTTSGNGESQIYLASTLSPESRSLGFPNATLAAVSRDGELALFRTPDTVSDGPMLVRAPMNGGAPRETARSIIGADWAPDGDTLAAVRDAGSGQFGIEYPLGKMIYKGTGWASCLRVSPDGEHVAFLEHPIATDDAGVVRIVDRGGHTTVQSRLWATSDGLAWVPSGSEVWFTAGDSGTQRALHAISTKGAVRLIANAPGTLRIRDISQSGRVLISRDDVRMLMIGRNAAAARAQDLSWYDFSHADAISSDGNLILFTEGGEAGGAAYSTYIHNQVTGATTRVGRGRGLAISPDRGSILSMEVTRADSLSVVPLNAGQAKTLPGGGVQYQWATFFPDGKKVLAGGSLPGQPFRMFTQTLDGATPVPLRTNVSLYDAVISPDGLKVAGRTPEMDLVILSLDTLQLHQIPRSSDVMPLVWAPDGSHLLGATRNSPALSNAWNLVWVDAAGTRSAVVSTLTPPDLSGLVDLAGIAVTPSGQAWVTSWRRLVSQLYVVDGWS